MYDKPILQDYVIKADKKPQEFFHCFGQIEEDTETKLYYESFFSVLVFFEEIFLQKIREKYFIPKALIIYSRNPYFVLHKYILNLIYQRCLSTQEYPIEIIIFIFFSLIRKKSLYSAKHLIFQNFFTDFEYLMEKETFLPIIDFNIGAFFKHFTFDNFLLLTEYFLTRSTILIYSNQVENLFPFYFTLMNMIYPLNNTNIKYEYYQYCTSSTFFHIIKNSISCIFAINAMLTEAQLQDLIKVRGDKILAVDLKNYTIKLYDPDNLGFEMDEAFEKNLILKEIFDSIIEKDKFEEIKLTYWINYAIDQTNKKLCEKSEISYYDYSLADVNYINQINELRIRLFSLFVKFLTFHQPFIKFEVLKENSVNIKLEDENFLKIFDNKKIKEFYSFFITTSSFCQICYRDGINPYTVKNFIILNELIKIYIKDKNRIYFDFFKFSELEKITDNKKEIAKKNFSIKVLSECKQIRIKFQHLQVLFLELIERHQELKLFNYDKNLILNKLKIDNIHYILLKYIYFDFSKYLLSKYEREFIDIYKRYFSGKKNVTIPFKDSTSDQFRGKSFDNNIGFFSKWNNTNNEQENLNNKFISLNINNAFNTQASLQFSSELSSLRKHVSDILIMELVVFRFLNNSDILDLNYKNPEEIILICYILILTITIFFKFSNTKLFINSKKNNFEKFSLIYKLYKQRIKELNRFFFINSIIYEIIKYLEMKEIYNLEFLLTLNENNIIPNFNISMDNNCEKKNNSSSNKYSQADSNEIFNFSYFNKDRQRDIENCYSKLNIMEDYYLICSNHEINFSQNIDMFKNFIRIKNSKEMKCRNIKEENIDCQYFLFTKNKSFNFYHPRFLLLFLLEKIIKNHSLTFIFEDFFSKIKDENYFENLFICFRNYNYDVDIIFKN